MVPMVLRWAMEVCQEVVFSHAITIHNPLGKVTNQLTNSKILLSKSRRKEATFLLMCCCWHIYGNNIPLMFIFIAVSVASYVRLFQLGEQNPSVIFSVSFFTPAPLYTVAPLPSLFRRSYRATCATGQFSWHHSRLLFNSVNPHLLELIKSQCLVLKSPWMLSFSSQCSSFIPNWSG